MEHAEVRLKPVGIHIFTGVVMEVLTAIFGLVVFWSFSSIAPPANLKFWGWLVGGQLLVWTLANLGLIYYPMHAATIRFWTLIAVVIVVWTNADILVIIGLLMPYTTAEMRVAVALFGIGSIACIIFALPEFKWCNRLLITSVTGSLILSFTLRPVQSGAFLLPFLAIYAVAMLIQSEVIRDSLGGNRAARLAAVAQRDAKSRFLASASHDLGQPLQSARLFFDQAVRGENPDLRAKAVTQAEAAFASIGRQLHQMVQHLRLEASGVVPNIGEVAVGSAIARIASLAEPAAAQAELLIDAMPSRLYVLADVELLERALSNLVDNAIRHAKATRLLIGARRHGKAVRIWVIDDGAGIAPADIPRLFEDYVQGSDHGDEVRGGFGLGLASVRRIATLMGGAAGVDLRWKRGAAFFLELPEVP